MLKDNVTPHDVVEVLNRAVNADWNAMHALVESRVPCNEALANDPTIQVSGYDEHTGELTPGRYKVGVLGLLNGLFGTDDKGWGCIAAEYEVVCPNGHKVADDAKVGDQCPVCAQINSSTKLMLGRLTGFSIIDESRR